MVKIQFNLCKCLFIYAFPSLRVRFIIFDIHSGVLLAKIFFSAPWSCLQTARHSDTCIVHGNVVHYYGTLSNTMPYGALFAEY